MQAVSYTHLDVYKRQEQTITQNSQSRTRDFLQGSLMVDRLTLLVRGAARVLISGKRIGNPPVGLAILATCNIGRVASP